MTLKPAVSLSHAGVFVNDMDKMVDFYTRFFGFVVSDRGTSRNGSHIVFMTSSPEEHHQFAMITGRPDDVAFNVVMQISFRVDSLATLRRMHASILEEGLVPQPMTHGNALSVYFYDPEGNRIELLIDTPWHVPQPLGITVDMSLPDDQLWAFLEEQARARPGFKPRKEWQADIAAKLAAR